MSSGEDTETGDQREEISEPSSAPKPELRKWINVNIELTDSHYIASFNHGKRRVFHNMPQLLTAIEVESAKLGPGPAQT
ncbi:MAG: hypothetical protein KAS87_01460 [Candidatus Omnitrophica bacterium]|nr:hypothetical protein [Candidatus Omnitrophota bacterium]